MQSFLILEGQIYVFTKKKALLNTVTAFWRLCDIALLQSHFAITEMPLGSVITPFDST